MMHSTKDPTTISVIDTSRMSPEERAALELTEAARTKAGRRNSLAGSYFMGHPDFSHVAPFPRQSTEDRDQGDAFLSRLRTFLEEHVDADEIDQTGEIPKHVLSGLARLGAFGIKIPKKYGGLGLSQTNYSRAAKELGRVCGNLTALVSAHQSIGVPQPLLMFGTEAQKQKYLPRLAKGEISAFALTEPDVGSDPAKMTTIARPVDGGNAYEISGEKLWCTNGTIAGLLVVMAKVVPTTEDARDPSSAKTITAFVVEADAPGVEQICRCRFMGLRALYNGVIHFDKVRVPTQNIILGEGRGLKVALSTLNTGRLTLPAACSGMNQECLKIIRAWTKARVQWGTSIGNHDAIAQKVATIAADSLATEAMVAYTSSLVDRNKKADIRIEAAMAKMWGTERAWDIVNETMQIRGGRGYETAQSLQAREEAPVPVERFLRDCRINTIFEGSSEIMRLFIAREALDPHLGRGGPVLNSQLPWKDRLEALWKSALFYSHWYPSLWIPNPLPVQGGLHHPDKLRIHLRVVRGLSRRLARGLFHAMMIHGPTLEKKQALLGRFVDAGSELFAMTVVLGYAKSDQEQRIAEFFCQKSALRVRELLRRTRSHTDRTGKVLAKEILS